jgi:hypothetical protein
MGFADLSMREKISSPTTSFWSYISSSNILPFLPDEPLFYFSPPLSLGLFVVLFRS